MRTIQIVVVQGVEGASLQVWGKSGGTRVAGPKAWGNSYNKPSHSFVVDADELIENIRRLAVAEPPAPEPKEESRE